MFERRYDSEDGPIPNWSAVLRVDGAPLTVWRSYLDQFDAESNPGLQVAGSVGCFAVDPDTSRADCGAYARGMSGATRGDVTGHYLLMVGAFESKYHPSDEVANPVTESTPVDLRLPASP